MSIPDKQRVRALIQAQQWMEAKTLCTQVCRSSGNDAEAWFLLGAINGQLGAFDEAEKCCRRVIAINPNVPLAHYNLGIALQRQEKIDQAIECFKQAQRLKPDFAEAYNELGVVLQSKGQAEAAVEAYGKAARLKPGYAEAYHNLGAVLRLLGRNEEALANFQLAMKYRPDHIETHCQIASVYADLKRPNEAITHYQIAIKARPDDAQLLNSLAGAFMERLASIDDLAEAERCYREALRLRPDLILLYINLTVLLRNTGRHDEAKICFQQILELDPGNVEAIAGMANVLEYKGEYEEAYKLLEPLLANKNINSHVAICFGSVARHVDRRAEAVAILESQAQEPLSPRELRNIHFQCGKLYDEMREYEKAFDHFHLAHSLAVADFDMKRHEKLIDDLIDVFSADKNPRRPRARIRSEVPVFIVGMPRSGTTLVEQILASHPDVFGAGELGDIQKIVATLPAVIGTSTPYPRCVDELKQEALDELSQGYLSVLANFSPTAKRVTDKMPHNFLNLGIISLLFPNARVIHCRRDPIDTCLSIYCLPFNTAHPYTDNLAHLGVYYLQYLRLMAHWKSVLSIPVLEIQYEDLIGDQERWSRKLVEFCGLEWDDRCLRFYETNRSASTHSYDQVRRPIYKKSVARWKNYEQHLGPLIAALGEEGEAHVMNALEALPQGDAP